MDEPAPLLETNDFPRPTGGEARWVLGEDGTRLRAALFPAIGRERGSVVLSGGRTEPIEKYYELIGELQRRGFVVLAHDWRGQGLSQRPAFDYFAGHAEGFEPFVSDYKRVIDAFAERMPRPWLEVSHSMGGCITLLSMALGERRFSGAVMSAPMFGVNTGETPAWQVGLILTVMRLLRRSRRYVPQAQSDPAAQTFELNALSHDRDRYERVARLLAQHPKLRLAGPTYSWLAFAVKAGRWLAKSPRLRDVAIPIVILQADEDTVVDNAAEAAVAERLPNARLVTVPGARHEILQEIDPVREVFWTEFDALAERVSSPSA